MPGTSTPPRTDSEQKVVDFAEDLGKLLGTTQAKAAAWLDQRRSISDQLTKLRDAANDLLQQLTGGAATLAVAVRRARRGRPAGSRNKAKASSAAKRGPARPKGSGKKRPKLSAESRAKMAEAARKRWAAKKAGAKG